ncbi:MAG: DUF2085 domain-containing protein [Clostridia bacterium]
MGKTLDKKDKIWLKLMKFGARLGCHQRQDRSFSWKGYQFPVCARCTGVILGYVFTPLIYLAPKRIRIYIALALCAVMFIDWLVQHLKIHSSNNVRRLITGTMAGAGLLYIYIEFFKYILRFILK